MWIPQPHTHTGFSYGFSPLIISVSLSRTHCACSSREERGRCSIAGSFKDFYQQRGKRRAEGGPLSKPGIFHISLFNLTLEKGEREKQSPGLCFANTSQSTFLIRVPWGCSFKVQHFFLSSPPPFPCSLTQSAPADTHTVINISTMLHRFCHTVPAWALVRMHLAGGG